jgi:hypothetical protein
VLHALTRLPALVVAIVAVVLPQRYWSRYPIWLPLATAGFLSGILTIFLGAAIGIPGFLEHAGATVSLANAAMLDPRNDAAGYNRGMVQGFSGLAIFTFLFLTPLGLLTLYLFVSGTVRAAAAWFEDPIGDPLLTGIDYALFAGAERHRTTRERTTREALEGPEVPDRIVSAASAGLPPCDLVVVASRRKPGWERGVTIFTQDAAYRVGDPVERTIAGRLRTLYPLTTHGDLEAIRKSVHYDLPPKPEPSE